jgi:uncharacterized glyoxalase superfamily protein PhnB
MPTIETIIPLLVYEDIERAHDFLVDAFGFRTAGVERDSDGQVVHGEVVAGHDAIWLHRVTPEHEPPARTSTRNPSTSPTVSASTAFAIPRATAGGSRPR